MLSAITDIVESDVKLQ